VLQGSASMGRRTLTISIAVLALWAAAASAAGVNPPPRPLHKVGNHWTPYQPPTEFPPDAQVYVIKPGDTLWDLAKQFLGDPYLWPQLWEHNQYVKDAHWIYPGDPLVVNVKAKTAETPGGPAAAAPPGGAAAGTGEAETGAPPAGASEATPPPVPGEAAPPTGAEGGATPPPPAAAAGAQGEFVVVGSEDDVYCFAYLDDVNAAPRFTVSSGEKIQYQDDFVTGDIVYISGGDDEGVKAGDEFFVVDPGPELHHPVTDAVLGRVMRYIGRLRVLCTQEHTSTAEILSSCDPVQVGSWLKPFEPIPIPMTMLTPLTNRCETPNDKPKGFIVYSKDDIVTFGQDHVVMVDLGEADQATPGTICTIYRDNPAQGMPRILLGELAILTAGEHWATAKIVASSLPMSVGDRIEIK
jgi:LysM repeat protein